MEKNPYAPDPEDLPDSLPIFPLPGALLLPGGQLPLHIFEPRYRAMVEDALTDNRLIGIVQPKDDTTSIIADNAPVYEAGCAGKITEFSETPDGRYMLSLAGICRFRIARELKMKRGYRRVKPGWKDYRGDLAEEEGLGLDRARLKKLLEKYFDHEGMECDWKAIDGAPDGKLITCLSMVCPFAPREKQALLEAESGKARAEMFMTMLEMAVCDARACDSRH